MAITGPSWRNWNQHQPKATRMPRNHQRGIVGLSSEPDILDGLQTFEREFDDSDRTWGEDVAALQSDVCSESNCEWTDWWLPIYTDVQFLAELSWSMSHLTSMKSATPRTNIKGGGDISFLARWSNALKIKPLQGLGTVEQSCAKCYFFLSRL